MLTDRSLPLLSLMLGGNVAPVTPSGGLIGLGRKGHPFRYG